MRTVLILLMIMVAAAAVSIPAAMRCPDIADAHVATGWQEYRSGRIASAHSAFESAQHRCPGHLDSQVGLGYVALRNLSFDTASAIFDRVLGRHPDHIEAVVGLGLVEWRRERFDSARAIFARALRIDPAREDVRDHVAKLPPPMGPPPARPPLVLTDSVNMFARVNGEYFEVRTGEEWQPFYINGVNLGAALPGRFPSEFPHAGVYAQWLSDIAEMGANTVRVYTLHPPQFYRALAMHNAEHQENPIWLLQGVWAELPPGDDYYAPKWEGEFFGEMERVIDALHGRADVPRRPGHASGYYTADVSRWTLGFILGREWEPYSVAEFNERYSTRDSFHGRYVAIADATPMDAWLTRAVEHAVAYETTKYRMQRPVSYTNWPTLDPMRHPTELDAATELTIRGVDYDRTRRVHNEDEVSIGAVAMTPTAEFPAGYFAAYHVYPYYPDFFLQDQQYAQASSPYGRSAYFGYLQELKAHVPGVPLVIAEYGVPASWGIAHFNPQGWHHGGHTEQQMADINVRLSREIAAAGMAGGVLFAWIDEWFKHNWLALPFELPAERNRMWWNRMDAEQHYGVLAVEPEPRLGETVRARAAAWDTVPALYAGLDGTRIRAHADEAYLWLQVSGPARSAPRLLIGFDIVEPQGGELRLPGAGAPLSPVGLEFVLQVENDTVRVLGSQHAKPHLIQEVPRGATKRDLQAVVANWPAGFFTGSYTQALNEPFDMSAMTNDGRWSPLYAAVNRARAGADSTNYFGFGYDRGVLPRGPLPDGAWEVDEWANALEVRIPWNLINVTDPSSRHVVAETRGARPDGEIGTRQVEAIRIVAAVQRVDGEWRSYPETRRRNDVASFTWPTWDTPRFRTRRRPTFDAMQAVFRELSSVAAERMTDQ